MILEKVNLFDKKKDFFIFLLLCLFILFFSLLIEYNNYKNLTRFDSSIINVEVLKQYKKTKLTPSNKQKTYQVLKLKSKENFNFYTSAKKSQNNIIGKNIQVEVFAGKISFYEYLTSFYAYIKILSISKNSTLKEELTRYIDNTHEDKHIADIYKALYTATQLPRDLQGTFSELGISHLLTISGFHLGVLATLLFFIFKLPYKFLQNRYFPYRSYKLDSFIFISITLLIYLIFLDTPPSLLRSYAMMLIAFFLYDRGYKIISMQTLLLTVVILLALFPRLLFSLGFWLSIMGVFYIFLFLLHFKHLSKTWQFILIGFWVYLMMLPYSLVIFSSWSIYHPLSIIWTILFNLFYPLSIILHLFGYGEILDNILRELLTLNYKHVDIYLDKLWLVGFILLSFLSIIKRNIIFFLITISISLTIYSIYQIT